LLSLKRKGWQGNDGREFLQEEKEDTRYISSKRLLRLGKGRRSSNLPSENEAKKGSSDRTKRQLFCSREKSSGGRNRNVQFMGKMKRRQGGKRIS